MKMRQLLSFLIIGLFVFSVVDSYAEIIYTKDGRTISGKIVSKIRDTIWYEVLAGDSTGRVGIKINNVSRILNDDGTISRYSPTYIAEVRVEADLSEKEKRAEESAYLMGKFFGRSEESDEVEDIPEEIITTTETDIEMEKTLRKEEEAEVQQVAVTDAAGALKEEPHFYAPEPEKAIRRPSGLLSGVSSGVFIFGLIVMLAFYAYYCFCVQTIAKKTGTPKAWLAWIPFVHLFLLLNICKRPKSWVYILAALLLLCLIPIVNLIGSLGIFIFTVILWCDIARIRNRPAWLGALMILPIANLIIPGYLAFSE